MRVLLFVLLLFVAGDVSGQLEKYSWSVVDGRVEYEGVVDIEGVTASQLTENLYNELKRIWPFKKDDIILYDKSNGEINVKAWITGFFFMAKVNVKFDLDIKCKEGKYKYKFHNYFITFADGTTHRLEDYMRKAVGSGKKFSKDNHEQIIALIAQLEAAASKVSTDDW